MVPCGAPHATLYAEKIPSGSHYQPPLGTTASYKEDESPSLLLGLTQDAGTYVNYARLPTPLNEQTIRDPGESSDAKGVLFRVLWVEISNGLLPIVTSTQLIRALLFFRSSP